MRVAAGQRLRFTDTGAHSNAGRIEVIGSAAQGPAELEIAGPLTNAAGTGLIIGRIASLRFSSGLTNAGSLALSFGVSDVFGDIANTGNITIASGGTVTFFDDLDQQGALTVSAGARADFFGSFTGGGFTGGGDVHLLGDLRPGNSPADVLMQGNVVLGSTTITQIELGGTTPGSEYDRLTIDGDVHFDGTLLVETIYAEGGLFQPMIGDSFVIATYSTHSGQFASEQLPQLSQPGATGSLQYGENALTLTAQGLPGDVNVDGTVDRLDMAALVRHLGNTEGTWATGDLDGDGLTGLSDLSLLQANLGLTAAPAASQAAVPEPTTFTLAFLGLIGCAARRRRRRR